MGTVRLGLAASQLRSCPATLLLFPFPSRFLPWQISKVPLSMHIFPRDLGTHPHRTMDA